MVGADNVFVEPSEVLVWECDGYTLERHPPEAVVLPGTTQEVSEVMRLLYEAGVPVIPRGAGTSLSGSTVPLQGGVVVCLSRMKQVLEIDLENRRAVVEPGVVNLWLTRAVEGRRVPLRPRPVEPGACTIGGNVATNSGGPHTLKYGVTVNHVLGVEMVLPDGTRRRTGGAAEDNPGYDLTGLIVGYEGTFGVVTKVSVRLTRDPEAYRTLLGVFESVDDATETVSGIIGRRHRPRGARDARQPDDPGRRSRRSTSASRPTRGPS